MQLTHHNSTFYLTGDKDFLKRTAEGWHHREDGTLWTTNPFAASLQLTHADAATRDFFRPKLERLKLSRAESSFFPCTELSGGLPLDDTQRVGVEWAVKTPHTLIADPMGSGKTAMALVSANTLGAERILVLCPAIVKQNWHREFGRFYIHQTDDLEVVYGSNHKLTKKRIIMNYDLVHRPAMLEQLQKLKFDLIIFDEIHNLKSLEAKRTQACLSLEGVYHLAERHIALSGTPLTSRPKELYPTFISFAPDALTPHQDYFDFTRQFCGAYKDRFGWNDKGASNLKELNFRLRTSFMLRRPPELFRKSAPTIVYQSVDLKNHKEYLDIENSLLSAPEYASVLEDLDSDFMMKKSEKSNQNLGDAAKMRVRLSELKIPPVIDFIKETLASDEKIVVFCHHSVMVRGIIEQVGERRCVKITGDTPTKEREKAVERLTSDTSVKVLVGNIQAAGTGLDGLQHAAHICLFAETTWTPGEIDQAIARLDRRGQTQQVYAYFLTVKGSIDEMIMGSINNKRNTLKEVLQ